MSAQEPGADELDAAQVALEAVAERVADGRVQDDDRSRIEIGVVSRGAQQLSEKWRQVLVEKEPHALVRSGSSRSRTASAA